MTAPDHYLNQYRLIISGVFWNSLERNFIKSAEELNLNLPPYLPRARPMSYQTFEVGHGWETTRYNIWFNHQRGGNCRQKNEMFFLLYMPCLWYSNANITSNNFMMSRTYTYIDYKLLSLLCYYGIIHQNYKKTIINYFILLYSARIQAVYGASQRTYLNIWHTVKKQLRPLWPSCGPSTESPFRWQAPEYHLPWHVSGTKGSMRSVCRITK